MEQGFSELEIKVLPWDDTICFFPLPEASGLPFDIFAASFYLLSRYEEYLPILKWKRSAHIPIKLLKKPLFLKMKVR